MALSNDEQHALDEIERALRDEDPVSCKPSISIVSGCAG